MVVELSKMSTLDKDATQAQVDEEACKSTCGKYAKDTECLKKLKEQVGQDLSILKDKCENKENGLCKIWTGVDPSTGQESGENTAQKCPSGKSKEPDKQDDPTCEGIGTPGRTRAGKEATVVEYASVRCTLYIWCTCSRETSMMPGDSGGYVAVSGETETTTSTATAGVESTAS